MPSSEPKSKSDLEEQRKASLPDALSEQQLQRVSTGRVRYALSQLAQNNVEAVQGWLDAIVVTDGPAKALELYLKLLEYSVPKLTRTEVKVESDGNDTPLDRLDYSDLQDMVRNGVQELVKQEAKRQGVTLEGEATHVPNPNA